MRIKDPAVIRRARKAMGYTQRDLAFLCDRASHTTIYLIETGRLKSITDQLAFKIAKRLQRPWEDLFVDPDDVPAPVVENGVDAAISDEAGLAS